MKMRQFLRACAVFPIQIYQKTISFDHGWFSFLYPYGFCRFTPTCSEYCKQAILRKGVVKGAALGCWRVLRCHPWSQGGKDLVE